MTNQNPRGGTELQFEYLRKHVEPSLLNQVEICTSIPGKVPLHPTKLNILWQKNSCAYTYIFCKAKSNPL